jgi:hypothetical protein
MKCMPRQFAWALSGALLLLGILATPTLAGGWAVTTVDSLPPAIHAGQAYPVGFTIRQHGVSLFNQAQPRIRASSGTNQLNVAAKRDGEGHYIASVEFPSAGTWTWAVDQTPFATQDLGTLEVLPPVPTVETQPAVAPASTQDALLGYALAGVLALVVLLWRKPLPRLIR